MKLPSGSFEKIMEMTQSSIKVPYPIRVEGGARVARNTSFIRRQVLWGWIERVFKGEVREYLPIDHAGPILVLAVLSREARGAGAFVLALLEVHAGSIVGTGG